MPVSIINGTNKSPASSGQLKRFFTGEAGLDGQLILGYPVIGTPEGRLSVDAIWISRSKGIVVFDLVEGKEIEGFEGRQDELANLLESKLKAHRELSVRRQLQVPIHTITFAALGITAVVENVRAGCRAFEWKK